MQQKLGLIALVVRDYDDAIAFYTQVLGFDLIEDTPIPEQQKRWVVVAPHGANGSQILLARAVGEAGCRVRPRTQSRALWNGCSFSGPVR